MPIIRWRRGGETIARGRKMMRISVLPMFFCRRFLFLGASCTMMMLTVVFCRAIVVIPVTAVVVDIRSDISGVSRFPWPPHGFPVSSFRRCRAGRGRTLTARCRVTFFSGRCSEVTCVYEAWVRHSGYQCISRSCILTEHHHQYFYPRLWASATGPYSLVPMAVDVINASTEEHRQSSDSVTNIQSHNNVIAPSNFHSFHEPFPATPSKANIFCCLKGPSHACTAPSMAYVDKPEMTWPFARLFLLIIDEDHNIYWPQLLCKYFSWCFPSLCWYVCYPLWWDFLKWAFGLGQRASVYILYCREGPQTAKGVTQAHLQATPIVHCVLPLKASVTRGCRLWPLLGHVNRLGADSTRQSMQVAGQPPIVSTISTGSNGVVTTRLHGIPHSDNSCLYVPLYVPLTCRMHCWSVWLMHHCTQEQEILNISSREEQMCVSVVKINSTTAEVVIIHYQLLALYCCWCHGLLV